jgi:hypothetical protein
MALSAGEKRARGCPAEGRRGVMARGPGYFILAAAAAVTSAVAQSPRMPGGLPAALGNFTKAARPGRRETGVFA